MNRLVIHDALVVSPRGDSARHGAQMSEIYTQEHATVIVDAEGRIDYVGTRVKAEADNVIDAHGRVLLPGFIDSHTHAVFDGYRPDEFEMRLQGASYMDIMRAGGGIQCTVDATRRGSVSHLTELSRWLLLQMRKMGVTTVEAKSGYGLDTETEMKMLDVIARLQADSALGMDVVATFMGAHAVPREMKGRTGEYVDKVINEMLPEAARKATFFDVFCEKDVFEIEDTRRMLRAARAAGMKTKLHADEIVSLGGAELAAAEGATSADHLLHISEAGIRALAESDTVATLLPLTAFSLKDSYAPARRMIDAGCAVALATDLNPGSAFGGSIPLMIALSAIYMNMTVAEIISALTINAAAALDCADTVGTITPGKWGNLNLLHFNNPRFLSYYIGMNCVEQTYYHGKP